MQASRCRSSSSVCVQPSRVRGSPPGSPEDPSGQARPRSAWPTALRRSSTLLRTTQSWREVPDGGRCSCGHVLAPPSHLPPFTCPPAHSLAHSLPLPRPWVECPPSSAAARCRRQRPHTGPGRVQGLAVSHVPWPAAPLGPDLFSGCSSHLAKLGAQLLGLGRVWPCQVGPQLPDVAEAEACSGCGAAMLGGVVHWLQLGGQEEARVGGADTLGRSQHPWTGC